MVMRPAMRRFTCAIKAFNSSVVCWGHDEWGDATPPEDLGAVLADTVGGHHTCAIKNSTRTVVCWGRDNYGQASPPEHLVWPSLFSSLFSSFWVMCAFGRVFGPRSICTT